MGMSGVMEAARTIWVVLYRRLEPVGRVGAPRRSRSSESSERREREGEKKEEERENPVGSGVACTAHLLLARNVVSTWVSSPGPDVLSFFGLVLSCLVY